jgi:hypothetical protein
VLANTKALVFMAIFLLSLSGCGDDSGTGSGQESLAPEAGMIVGRVTMEDGAALRGQVKDVQIGIQGVSEAGERVSFSPVVKPDGSYRLEVPDGQYSFAPSRIVTIHEEIEHLFPLEPVGMNWNKNQDVTPGISQDFIWKVTGPTPYGVSNGKDVGNATHWYGRSISLRAEGYREDIKQAPRPIPEGTALTLVFKPIGTVVDGTSLNGPITVERTYSANLNGNYDVADLPPAGYELSGTAGLPDGSTQPLLFNGEGYGSAYTPNKVLKLEVDGLIGGMFKPIVTFVID